MAACRPEGEEEGSKKRESIDLEVAEVVASSKNLGSEGN